MEIELCGYKVLIDDEDYEKVMSYKWSIHDKAKANIYFRATRKNKRIKLHRLIFGKIKEGCVLDHINGNTLDNRKSNLRAVTITQNNRNRKNMNSTGLKGVSYHPKCHKWQARICTDTGRISLGYFDTKQLAHLAYCEASKKYHGEYGRTE